MGSFVRDAQPEDARARGDICFELACDVARALPLGPDDDGRARARQRDADGPVGRVRAKRLQERRVRRAVLLVQAVVEPTLEAVLEVLA